MLPSSSGQVPSPGGTPAVGDITFTYESVDLTPEGQRLAIYQTAPGTRDHEAMKLLALTTGPEQHT
jgi:hypothetical protein